ncbi:carbohydrate kinase [Asanoa ishikariensis]|uniref:Sugar (Pentulose or hexulose) kinase n=1 Tax=Asanoa ishikariensis TaxID=137265 RepID=A0A1H3MVM3_9ACTN|nr:FGGY family carbohydrate kinase [Asanoa ishikariensis]GIF66363.1 carbohydrate kinase [Asanoa ishikariensis]SDY80544.1 Sugar (pentulose or hexulose) kinase [Asanoa ishikariensis]
MLFAGVDVGTQSLRVLLADEHGTVVARAGVPLTGRRTGDRHEQDPADWWAALGSAFRQVLRDVSPDQVAALAICATSGTFLLADRDGTPHTPALMYDDARAPADAGMQRTWALPKLLWLLRHGPAEVRSGLAAGRLVVRHCGDHLADRLTGELVATDWTSALKTGYDDGWAASEVPAAALPEVVRPGTLIGTVGPAGAAHTGLPVGVPVRAGLTDGCAAQVAAGALAAGSWNSVLGTTLVVKGVTTARLADPSGAVYSHRHPDGGWLPGGASNVGAAVVDDQFPGADRAALELKAVKHEPAGAVVYPLRGRGERFPFVRPEAEAFTLGEFASPADHYAGLLQGVAYVERLCYAHLRRLGADTTGSLALTGGATRSRYWSQLRADVLGRPALIPATPEPALGMAVVAAAGDGGLTATAAQMVRIADIVVPRPGDRFAEPFARFVDALADRGHVDAALAAYAKEPA